MSLPTFENKYTGFKKGPRRTSNDLKTGSLVDFILLRSGLPSMLPDSTEEPTIANSGIEWELAAISKAPVNGESEVVFFDGPDGELLVPGYVATTRVVAYPPLVHKSLKTKTGKYIGNFMRNGGGNEFKNDNPEIVNLFPYILDKDSDSMRSNENLKDWSLLIQWYAEHITNAEENLNSYIARRLLLYKKPENLEKKGKIEWLKPEKGMVFRAQVYRSPAREDSGYFSINAFSLLQKDANGKYFREFYNQDGAQITERSVQYADEIIKAIDKSKERRARTETINDSEEEEPDNTKAPWED